jgi:hypothetical protein
MVENGSMRPPRMAMRMDLRAGKSSEQVCMHQLRYRLHALPRMVGDSVVRTMRIEFLLSRKYR